MSILGNNLLAQYYAQQNMSLPKEYMAVEYISSNSNQRIDTQFRATERTKAVVDLKMNVLGTWVFGSRNNDTATLATDSFCLFPYSNGNIFAPIGRGFPTIEASFDTKRHIVEMSLYSGVVLDGILVHEYTQTQKEYTFSSTYPWALFTMRMGQVYNNYMSGRIYRFYCLENSLRVCDFVPCVRKLDNKPGMYDLCKSICPLTGTPFYINAGTGEFVTP